jgi:hypothetical protein
MRDAKRSAVNLRTARERSATIVIALALAGCESGEALAPVPVDGGDGDAAPPPAAVSVKRTVTTRSPLGERAGNHLIDGDFELSTDFGPGGQFGALGFNSDGSGQKELPVETGGLCRSGLRCAVVDATTLAFLRGASPRGKGSVASIWAKIPEGSKCTAVRAIVVTCDTADVIRVLPAQKTLDQGWCQYRGAIAEMTQSACLYVDNTLPKGTTALLDAATLVPDDGTVQPLAETKWTPDEQTLARLANIRRSLAAMPISSSRRAPPSPW